MIVKKIASISLLLHFILLLVAFFFFIVIEGVSSYSRACSIGTLFVVFSFLFFLVSQKRIISILSIFIVVFILFQFGLPIIYSIDESYFNYYINLFDQDVLVASCKYSVVAIVLFIFSTQFFVLIFDNISNKNQGKYEIIFEKNKKYIEKASFLLFIVTSFAVIPLNFLQAFKAMSADGIILNYYRGIMSENGITKFCQEYFFLSGLLYFCFSSNRRIKLFFIFVYFSVSISLIIVADRNGGISSLVSFLMYLYYTKFKGNSIKSFFSVLIVGILLAAISSIVASTRLGYELGDLYQILLNVIDEMGFNFTSMCFVYDYVPSLYDYSYGKSYLSSFILLLPSSLGGAEFYSVFHSYLGEAWLDNAITFLNFGVGFSLIAESYFNFSNYGLIVMPFIAAIITFFVRDGKESSWSIYVKVSLMLCLFTLARRQFASLLKGIEYSVFFMWLYLVVFLNIWKSRSLSKYSW